MSKSPNTVQGSSGLDYELVENGRWKAEAEPYRGTININRRSDPF